MISEHKRAQESKVREKASPLNAKELFGKRARMWRQMDCRRISKNREEIIEKERRRRQGLTKRNCASPTQMVGLAQQTDQ